MDKVDLVENRRRMQAGELYYAFVSDLTQERAACGHAVDEYNQMSRLSSRRALLSKWNVITKCDKPLPPQAETQDEDDAQLDDWPWVEMPVRMDYGYNVHLGDNVYVNANSTWIDTSPITIGSRTLIGPNCSFYSGTHPVDGRVRQGTRGPELGKPIVIGEDCWLGGNVIVLPGVTIGNNSTVGAGSVVTKDVPAGVVVAGNPAKVIRKVESGGGDGSTEVHR